MEVVNDHRPQNVLCSFHMFFTKSTGIHGCSEVQYMKMVIKMGVTRKEVQSRMSESMFKANILTSFLACLRPVKIQQNLQSCGRTGTQC